VRKGKTENMVARKGMRRPGVPWIGGKKNDRKRTECLGKKTRGEHEKLSIPEKREDRKNPPNMEARGGKRRE